MGKQAHPSIALITDSTCDIPDDVLKQYDIRFVPQVLIWGTEEFRDRVDIQAKDFYERLAADPVPPKSSQPVAHDFAAALDAACREGAQEVVVLTLSNQLSGTVDSARQAVALAGIPVHVVDSLSASMGLGWQVIAAARAREAGGDAPAMIAAADQARQRMAFFFFVDTLEFLHRGGRIGGAAKLLGTVLNLKPLLTVDHNIGRVETYEKIRTRSKAMERAYEAFFERMDTTRPMHIAIAHTNEPELAEATARRVQQEYPSAELVITFTSPVIGTHAGPGGVGLFGYYED
jgi:DegV family protein with EDD domain